MTKVDIIGQIADLKEIDYKNTLAIASIIEVLIDKGIIDRNDIAKKANDLENMTLDCNIDDCNKESHNTRNPA